MVMFVSCHHVWDSAICYSSSLMHIDAASIPSTNSLYFVIVHGIVRPRHSDESSYTGSKKVHSNLH